jgi:prepilin-type processing-associated H-X9-DG protein
MYANNHKGAYPPDLAAMVRDQQLAPDVMIDPVDPQRKLGFVYVPPPQTSRWDQKEAVSLPILHEQIGEGHNVGYADGHVEWFATREEVERLFKQPAK